MSTLRSLRPTRPLLEACRRDLATLAAITSYEMPSPQFWAAAALMGLGVWLHVQERHEHEHTHELMDHILRHRHDEHHRHEHNFPWDGAEPHVHPHRHEVLTHKHPHYPDIHHRHAHRGGSH